jgi:hypothetical protein
MKYYVTGADELVLTDEQAANLDELRSEFDESTIIRALEYDMYDTDQHVTGNTIFDDYKKCKRIIKSYINNHRGQ